MYVSTYVRTCVMCINVRMYVCMYEDRLVGIRTCVYYVLVCMPVRRYVQMNTYVIHCLYVHMHKEMFYTYVSTCVGTVLLYTYVYIISDVPALTGAHSVIVCGSPLSPIHCGHTCCSVAGWKPCMV